MITLLMILIIYKSALASEIKNVLVIHSYNEGFSWTNSISKGINDELNKSNKTLNVLYDYMDLKEMNGKDYFEKFYEIQRIKYANRKFDVIITSDNGAMDYIMQYGDKLFKDTPIVFCGVNKSSFLNLADNISHKFVTEEIDITTMIKNIEQIMPNVTTINVFANNTDSGKNDLNYIKNFQPYYKSRLKFDFYEGYTLENLKAKIETSDDTTAFLFMTDPFVDRYGIYRYINNVKDNIFKDSKAPLFSFWDFDLGYGTIGGKVTSGYYQGKSAAGIALKILNNISLENIQRVTQSPNKYIYDFNQLKRFNVSLNTIPKESIILNKPFSFYENYKHLVIGTLIMFLLLVIIIVLLTLMVNEKRKNEIRLNENYEELASVYEELSATEEELRAQYDELQKNEEILRNSEERYKLAVDGSNDTIWEWDIQNKTLDISKKWMTLSGYSKMPCIDEIYDKVIYEEDKIFVKNTIQDSITNGKIFIREFRIITGDGSTKWVLTRGNILRDSKGNPIKMAGSITDISEIKEKENQIEELAYYDSLTGLPNRNLFISRLNVNLRNSDFFKDSIAIVFMDIDDFKKINDTLGHDKGDYVLQNIANRLQEHMPRKALVTRFGGDEFLIQIPSIQKMGDVENICNDILNIFKEPFMIDGVINYITTSIGVSMYPIDGKEYETLLKNADTAMYNAKEKGKNQYCFFNYDMEKEILRRIILENNLRNAIDNEEFELYYQPQINLHTGKIEGIEALIRWKSKELGMIPPNEFISIAEKTGLINPIGNWVIETACKQNKIWIDKGFKYNFIGVNVSCIQFIQSDFIESVRKILTEIGLPSNYLDIEITESLLIDSTEANINKLKELRDLGISISLDDFGTGYSSLNYLRRLPINILKIDKSFVDEICDKEEQRFITEVIIKLSHKLGCTVVAEGIEDEKQLKFLKDMQCDLGQGYYFSKPVPASEMEKLLLKNLNS